MAVIPKDEFTHSTSKSKSEIYTCKDKVINNAVFMTIP